MRIYNSIFPAMITGSLRDAVPQQRSTMSFPQQDLLEISEAAQQKIDRLQQGNQTLQQAVTQSRQADRSAAQERVSFAKEHLKILARMSPAGDRGAATEAARIAREIKGATAQFKESIPRGEGSGVRSEVAGFAGETREALTIASGLIESYLGKRVVQHKSETDLRKEISSALSTLREMVNSALAPAYSASPFP